MTNLSQKKREHMLEFLNQIREEHSDDSSLIAINEIENKLTSIRYGLVWEEHEERVDIEMKTKVPVFTEVTEREIKGDKNSNYFNFLLEGDNLHSLKLLEKTHRGKIDAIYIDPPYNTGKKDFKYNDTYLKTDDVFKHSMWLSFMNERLEIAKKLMKDDALIFISIDENEGFQLKLLCDTIFGEENLISNLIWKKKKGGSNDARYVATEHEYIFMYTKNKNKLDKIFLPHSSDYLERYKNNDGIGRFYWDTFKRKSGKQYYPITCPDGTILQYEKNGDTISWLRSENRFKNDLEIGDIRIVQVKGKWTVHFKQREPQGKKPRTILLDVGTTSSGSQELKNMFGRENIFSNPKPTSLIKYLLNFKSDNNITVLDFFAGTGTTGQAVLDLNESDGGNRHFILCTDNEEGICENITNKRIEKTIMGYNYIGKREDVLFEKKLAVKDLSNMESMLDNNNNIIESNSKKFDEIKQVLEEGILKVIGVTNYDETVAGISANLKYYKTDFVDKVSDNHLNYCITEALQSHIKEMVQLENGVGIGNDNHILLLTDEDADALESNSSRLEHCKGIYISRNVLLTSNQEKLFKSLEIKTIPDYYFENELREAGEL